MNDIRPRDCTCGFPKTRHTHDVGHAEWCPAYRRIMKRREEKSEKRWHEWLRECKDAEGRAVASGGEYVEPEL